MSINIPVSAIILAAGESTRMGIPKQLLPIGGTTMLGKVLDVLLGSQAEEIIVVVGHKTEEVVKIIRGKPVKIAFNRYYEQGMSTSIRAGLSLTSDKARGFMFALGDQPFVDVKIIDSLIQAFACHGKGIVVPVYEGRRGHPVIFSTKYKTELTSLKGDVGAKVIIANHKEDIFEVSVNSRAIIDDIDTIDEYIAEQRRILCDDSGFMF